MGAPNPPTSANQRLGVLTKTIIRTPVVRWILHARLRRREYNDVVFVGEDFLHVKQVVHEGHLEHVATKSDFGTRIRAARVFTVDTDPPEEDALIKVENGDASKTKPLPPQFVVLTLATDELVFLYLAGDQDGNRYFVHQTCPLPTYEETLWQVGEHLAIDPHSRGLAVAANQREVVLYSAKPKDRIQRELQASYADWCPVQSQRPLQVEGVIQHMEFLCPPDSDPDHVILLLILIDRRRTKALWIDWYYSDDNSGQQTNLHQAQMHPPQSIDSVKTVSSLMVPLLNAAFLFIVGDQVKLFQNLLSGSSAGMVIGLAESPTPYPGGSSRLPAWTSWCPPRRLKSARKAQDVVYLVREDGIVSLLLVNPNGTAESSFAGDVECHAGSAFASLGDPADPDILAIGGEQSNGRVVSIGHFQSGGRFIGEMSRVETMTMRRIESLPNWASATDMLVSSLPQSYGRSTRMRNSVFVTSGRQPYGAITELRQGLEARVSLSLSLGDLRGVTGSWSLPNVETGSVLLLMSMPSCTRLLDFDLRAADEIDVDRKTALELSERTLAADVLSNGHIMQVTERSVCTGATVFAGFEDRARRDCEPGNLIFAASIEPEVDLAFIIERGSGGSKILALKHYVQQGENISETLEEGLQQVGSAFALGSEALCLATTTTTINDLVIIVAATSNNSVSLLSRKTTDQADLEHHEEIPIPGSKESLGDHIVLLQTRDPGCSSSKLLAVCGLRDGKVFCVEVTVSPTPSFGDTNGLYFGHSTVRLSRHANEPWRAFAVSGTDTCVLTWDGRSPETLDIKSLWVSDKARPELSQDTVMAVSKLPHNDYVATADLADSLHIVSSEEIWVTSVDEAPTTVPRKIKVTGSPNRLIYAEQQRSLVCASVCTGVRSFPANMPHAKPEERRQIWPAIDFISLDRKPSGEEDLPESNVSFTFRFQPGDVVNALVEWSFTMKGKQYSFVMVAGSFMKTSKGETKERGRIAFLQPVIKSWEVVDVREGRSQNFDSPVLALTLYDELTYVACSGEDVIVSRFADDSKWSMICAPLSLASAGIAVTVKAPLIYIATLEDSLVIARLERLSASAQDGAYTHKLVTLATAPRRAESLCQAVVPLQRVSQQNNGHSSQDSESMVLLATKFQKLIGLSSPATDATSGRNLSLKSWIMFEAQLPRSISRINQGKIRPRWRKPPPSGVIADGIVGVAADGSLMGISVLGEGLWRRLFWLQRLCEWSEKLSPHSTESPTYGVDEDEYDGEERALPIGLDDDEDAEIALISDTDDLRPEQDMHIDGDVLGRLLEKGRAEALRKVIQEQALRQDRVGTWLTENLEDELEAVEDVIEEVEALLGAWL